MPPGLDVTLPLPVPPNDTPSVHEDGGGGSNVAVTVRDALMVAVHVPVALLHAPVHPANVLAPLGAAVSVTTVPAGNVVVQVVGQLMPAGLEVTTPLPAPAVPTVSANVLGGIGSNVAVTFFAA